PAPYYSCLQSPARMPTLARTVAISVLLGAPAMAQTAASRMTAAIAAADSMIDAAIAKNMFPGAVFVVSQNGKQTHERAFSFAELNDMNGQRIAQPRPMRTTTQ